AAIAEGIGFAFVKLTQGTSYTSPAAREQLDRLRAHGVHVGVYHYLDAGASAAAQWAHFAAELAKLPYWRSLVVALDYEAPGATDAQAAAFIAAGKRDGYRVGLYSSAGTHGYANVKPAFRWIAAWTAKPGKPPRSCRFWQWAHGAGGGPDWDLFVGDKAALAKFWTATAGRAVTYRVAVAGVTVGRYASWARATAAALAYMLAHPAKQSYRVDRVA